jgi:hypothetical protein
MGLFQKSPEKQIARSLDDERKNRDNLLRNIDAAEKAVAEHHSTAKRLARDGGHAGLEVEEAKLRRARDRLALLTESLADADNEIADLEGRQAAIADQKLRRENAAIVEIDAVISQTLAREALAAEHARRAVWRRTLESATSAPPPQLTR